MIFAPCILGKTRGKKTFAETKPLIRGRLEAWKLGHYFALVKDIEYANLEDGWGLPHDRVFELEEAGRKYDSMIRRGQVRSAVRVVTNRDLGGLFLPTDTCTKTGRPVIEFLHEQHPDAVIPEVSDFDVYSAKDTEEAKTTMPLYFTEEDVAKAAKNLGGCAGPTGIDGPMLRGWLLRKGIPSERLRIELAHWEEMISNGDPPFALYRALNYNRLLPANKCPGVRPMICGETTMRVIASVILQEVRPQATTACGNVQLCAGTRAGIEGNLHAVRAIWPESAGWKIDGDGIPQQTEHLNTQPEDDFPADPHAGTSKAANDPTFDGGADPDTSRSRYEEEVGYGQACFDAENAFGMAVRILLIWNVGHRWTKAARFIFNRYCHWCTCILRDKPGHKKHVIYSKEGTLQGDCFGGVIYGTGMLPLGEGMRAAIPQTLQPWFADDSASAGKARHNAACLKYLMKHGPRYGYHINPGKSWYICKEEVEEEARAAFAEHNLKIQFTRGHAYLGGFIGSAATKNEWLEDKITTWIAAVKTLSLIAARWPQSVYAEFTFCLQNEWQYVQRVLTDVGRAFDPLERAIRKYFLPALIGIPAAEIDPDFRDLLTHSVKLGGIAVRNPTDTPSHNIKTFMATTKHLVDSLVDGTPFNPNAHRRTASAAGKAGRIARLLRENGTLTCRGENDPVRELDAKTFRRYPFPQEPSS